MLLTTLEKLAYKIYHLVNLNGILLYQKPTSVGFLLTNKSFHVNIIFSEVAVQLNNIMKYKAYTYLIKVKTENKFYYGVRFKNIRLKRHPEEDFMKHYTTSSENINDIIKEHGLDALEWEIRKTFNTPEQAIAWETKVLRRSKVLERQEVWFNGNVAGYKITTKAGRKKISETHKGKPKTKEHKEKIRDGNIGKNTGRTQTLEHRRLNSEANSGKNNHRYGKEVSEYTRKLISDVKRANKNTAYNKGAAMSQKQKDAIRATKEKNKVLKTCEVCGKTMRESHYKIYSHGPACKQKPQ